MNFTLSDEQAMLKDSVSRFLRAHYGFERRRDFLAAGGSDAAIWSGIAELGLLGASLPEELGGLGGGAIETMVIMESFGEALVIEPYVETIVLGAGILKRVGDERSRKLIADIVTGKARVALAAGEPSARYDLGSPATVAVRDGDEWVIEGMKSVVDAAPVASHLILTAQVQGGAGGVSFFLVDKRPATLSSRDFRLLDGRSASDIRLEGLRLPADALLGEYGAGLPIVEAVRDEAIAAICAEAVGGMRRMLADTLQYTKQRKQFGQPLGSFQVLQHRMVDMYLAIERAASAVYLATLKLNADSRTRALAASSAKVTIAETARMVGQSAVQLHGGMGMTDELAVGHYFKRATVIESQFGSRDFHLARYAALTRPVAA